MSQERQEITVSTFGGSSVFHSFGVLEHILSFLPVDTLVKSATLVNRRWKEAGRNDAIWKAAIERKWKGKAMPVTTMAKVGENSKDEQNDNVNPIFWRCLYTQETVSRMTEGQLRSVFNHPLLIHKKQSVDAMVHKNDIEKYFQVHMLDILSELKDDDQRHCLQQPPEHSTGPLFFSDIYFGSYASSIRDSTRNKICMGELCNPYGYQMYFKILEEDVDEHDRESLIQYEHGILLFPYGRAYFEQSRGFRMDLGSHPQSEDERHHRSNLKWTWIDVGHRMQVGPYPPLTASRTPNWGWKLENLHVVLFGRESALLDTTSEAYGLPLVR